MAMVHQPEHARDLDAISAEYDPSDPASFDHFLKRLQADAIVRWLLGGRTLELGCATGELTSLLVPHATDYDVVEGSRRNIELASARVPGARFVHALWEDFVPDARYSDIVLVNALEHAGDATRIVANARSWLQPGGRIHVMVPNGHSLHRLVGVELGLLSDPVELTEADRRQGHVRNYTRETLHADLANGGVTIVHSQGIFLKLLSNTQMLGWDRDLVAALDGIVRRAPALEEHAAILYAVATVR